MGKIILVRHGQSQANADAVIATPDSPLTETGRQQARETGQRLRQEFTIDLVVCSPYTRARQTAEIIAGELGYSADHIQVLPDLHERDFATMENQPKHHPGEWYIEADNLPGLESRQAILDRMTRCLGELRQLAQDKTVLVVGHGTAGYYLRQAVAGKTAVAQLDPPRLLGNAEFEVIA